MFNPRNRHNQNQPNNPSELHFIRPQSEVTYTNQQRRADDVITRQLRLTYKLRGGRTSQQPSQRKITQ